MNYYFHNKNNRIGDEIQMTAFLQYIKKMYPEKTIFYRDENQYLSSREYFPEGLVTFCEDQPPCTEWLHTGNLWTSRNIFVRHGIYTRINRQHCPIENRAVFFPLLSPEYNFPRRMDIEVVKKMMSEYDNLTVYVDPHKSQDKRLLEAHNVPYSCVSLKEAIEVICASTCYIGGDTGFTHIAGAVGHTNIVAIYGNSDHDKNAFRHDQQWFSDHYQEKDSLAEWNYWCSLPCCPPKHLKTMIMENNSL
jgi:hypothetical protein